MAKGEKRLSVVTRLGYAAAEMGTTLSFYMISNYLTMFYMNGVGLAAGLVSALILAVRLIEAFSAPVIGSVIDRTMSKFGQCRPWLLWGMPFLIIFSILTFTTLPIGEAGKAVYAFISYTGLVIAFTFVDTAKGALVNTITADADDRVTLNGWRQACGNVMNTVLAGVTMPLILLLGNAEISYTITTAVYAALAIPLLLFAFSTCKETVKATATGERVSIKQSLTAAFKNKQLLCIILFTLISCTGIFYRLGIMVYYYNYAVGRPDMTGVILMGFQIAQILPPFVAPFIIKPLGKKGALIVSNVGMAVSCFFLHVIGFDSILLVFIGTFLLGLFSMGGFIGICAISDCIEYGYNTSGTRNPGASVGAMTFGVKIALAVGGSIGALFIAGTGYVADAEVTMGIREGISFVANIVPAIVFLVALLALIPYKLSNKEVARIQAENAEKDAAVIK